jgi:putative photosynthetic complex assembly protein 2
VVNDTILACSYAAMCWWFGTGIILWLDRLPPSSFRWSLGGWSILLVLSFWGVSESMRSVSVNNAYLGFGSVIVMWGWHELAFLTGWLTGTRKEPLQLGVVGLARFRQSLDVIIYHELALIVNLAALWLMQVDQPNHVALCTFALLWCMRISGKLNLYFGVPRNGAQYLPKHLDYLASYFPTRGITAWFVFSFSVALAVWIWIVSEAQRGVIEVTTGWVLLASLLGLGILEHAMMVLPWPSERLWGWALGTKNDVVLDSATLDSK